jgi:S-adenosyl methyltransferase
MTDRWLLDSTRRAKVARIDTTVPNWARVGDALIGGRDNFEADRKAVRMLAAAAPYVSAIPIAARAFRQRVVRYLVTEAGIRQFLDVGASLAMAGNTHEVAQSLAPDCRVVYVDNDPMVLAHARAQLASRPRSSVPGGAVTALDANPRDPAAILAVAAETLDLARPVAVLLMATLSFVLDDAAAARILRSLAGAVPAGSHVSLYHQASDLDPAMSVAAARWNAMSDRQVKLRSRAQLTGLLSGLDLVSPGIMPVTDWRPAPDDPRFEHLLPVYGAVARKA